MYREKTINWFSQRVEWSWKFLLHLLSNLLLLFSNTTFSVVDTIIHRSYWSFLKSLIIVPREACSCDIMFTVEMLVILPHISHLLGNRRVHFLSRSRDQAEVKRRKLEANLVLVLIWCLGWASWCWLVWWKIAW